jgi:hypothetical protein
MTRSIALSASLLLGSCLLVALSAAGGSSKDISVSAINSYRAPDQLRVAVIDIAAVFKGNQQFVESLKDIGNQLKQGLDESDRKSQEQSLYLDTLQRVTREIDQCCERHKIQIVFRVNKNPLDAKDPQDILRVINRPIQHFDQTLDITNEVIAGLNTRK